jgi:2,5-diketo-D-gluconate reductase A
VFLRYFSQPAVAAANAAHGILSQAWSPIGGITFYREGGTGSTLDDETIVAIGEAHWKAPAQVMRSLITSARTSVLPISRNTRPSSADLSRS